MKTQTLNQSWRGLTVENKFGRIIIVVLACVTLFQQIHIMNRDQIVVLPPPIWSSELNVGQGQANEEYLKTIGLAVANFLGNITPANVDFVKNNVARFFDPDVYARIREAIESQANAIKADGLSISFSPRQVLYEPSTQKVFVTGFTRTEGRGGQSESVQRTYEFKFSIVNYIPQATDFTIYRGPPATVDRVRATGGTPS